MAIVVSTIDSGIVALYDDNKPLFLSYNLLSADNGDVTLGAGPEAISACWRSTSSIETSPIDITAGTSGPNSDNVFSPLLACDKQLTGMTGPWNGTYSTPYNTHAITFKTEYSTTAALDSLVIANHNFAQLAGPGSASSDLVIRVAISDSNTFGTSHVIQEWEAPFTDERLLSLDLGNALGASGAYKSYTQINFLQVWFTGSASINGPQIGEVFAGSRRQLSRTPIYDTYNTNTTNNIVGTFTSKSGLDTRYAISTGREEQAPTFDPSGNAYEPAWYSKPELIARTDIGGQNDFATLKTFWEDINYGTDPFFYIPNVSGKQGECFYMFVDDMLFPATIGDGGISDREVDFQFLEVGPYYSSEV